MLDNIIVPDFNSQEFNNTTIPSFSQSLFLSSSFSFLPVLFPPPFPSSVQDFEYFYVTSHSPLSKTFHNEYSPVHSFIR